MTYEEARIAIRAMQLRIAKLETEADYEAHWIGDHTAHFLVYAPDAGPEEGYYATSIDDAIDIATRMRAERDKRLAEL